MRIVHMLKAHQDLSFRIGTHHCNYKERTHEYKKEESIFMLPPKLRFITTQHWTSKEFTGFIVAKRRKRAHKYPKMFDWERTYFLYSFEFRTKINVCLFGVWMCVCVCVCVCILSYKMFPKGLPTVWLMKRNFCFHWD